MASAQAEGHQRSQAFEFVDKSLASEVLDQPKITPKIGKEYFTVVRGVGSGVELPYLTSCVSVSNH